MDDDQTGQYGDGQYDDVDDSVMSGVDDKCDDCCGYDVDDDDDDDGALMMMMMMTMTVRQAR